MNKLLLVSSVLFLVLSGLLLLLSALLNLVGSGEWFGLARPVALFLLLSAAWNLALGITGAAASRRVGRGLACIIMGGLSLIGSAVLLLFSVISILGGQSPLEDEIPLLVLLLPRMILLTLYFAGAAGNRRAGRMEEGIWKSK